SREILHDALADLAGQGVTVIIALPPAEIPGFIVNRLHLGNGTIQFAGDKSHFSDNNQATDPELAEKRKKWIEEFGQPEANDFKCAFDLRNIHVAYHGKKVLDKLSWKVNKGERW